MDRDECRRSARPTPILKGQCVTRGEFVRNLKNSEVKRWHPKDPDDPPRFGYRVKWPPTWRDAERSEGISVNARVCLSNLECSIRLHPQAEQFCHVVTIDLALLSERCGYQVLAVYDPIDAPPDQANPCHFNLMPESEPLDDFLVALGDQLGVPCPKNLPKTTKEEETVRRALSDYSAIFRVERNVVGSSWPNRDEGAATSRSDAPSTPPPSPAA